MRHAPLVAVRARFSLALAPLAALAASVAIIALVVIATPGPAHAAPATPTPHAAAPAPAPRFALPGRTGATVALDSLHAKAVLVDFWASWCVPCRKSFPWMASLQERFGAKGLAIVAINLDKERPDAEAFLAKYPAPFSVAFDPAGRTAEAYRVTGMPTTVLVGADGTILARHLGFDARHTQEMETLITEACKR